MFMHKKQTCNIHFSNSYKSIMNLYKLRDWGLNEEIDKKTYSKDLFIYITCDYTWKCPAFNTHHLFTSPQIWSSYMLHFSVKIIPYKGLHLCLAIIPEEYIINIYCHQEWQWKTVLMYSTAKQRKKGSDVDWPAVSARTVCACSFDWCHSSWG